jgi:hypothetical protein
MMKNNIKNRNRLSSEYLAIPGLLWMVTLIYLMMQLVKA